MNTEKKNLIVPVDFKLDLDRFKIHKSHFSVCDTIKRMEEEVKALHGIVFGIVNHSANAKNIHQELRPTQVIMFGLPEIGTELMKANQSIALFLPSKIVVWEDSYGNVWAAYQRMESVAHEMGVKLDHNMVKINIFLKNVLCAGCGCEQ